MYSWIRKSGRGLHAATPFQDLTYERPKVEIAKTVGDVPPKSTGTAVGPGAAKDKIPEPEVPTTPELVPLLTQNERLLASVLYDIAVQYEFLTILRREDITIHDGSRDERQSVIDHYLEGSKARNAMALSDFITPAAFKCIFSAGSSSRILHQTGNCDVDPLAIEYFATLRNLYRSGQVDILWNSFPQFIDETVTLSPKSSPKMDTPISTLVPHPPPESLPDELLRLRFELTSVFTISLEQQRYNAAAESLLALLNTYGHTNMRLSATYLLHYQSIRVRDWLLGVWTDALSPTSAVTQTLSRVKRVQEELVPSVVSRQSVAIDVASLQSQVCWRRLDVSKSVSDILTETTGVCFLSLQLCDQRTTVYIAAGCDISNDGVDQWVIDKINLFESSRRTIQLLKQQHAAWVEDVTRFTAQFSENFTPEMDEEIDILNSTTSPHVDNSKKLTHTERLELIDSLQGLRRTEHALTERLKALLCDMERLFASLLGSDSITYKMLKHLSVTQPESTPLVLLIDPILQELPWEGLDICNVWKGGVCRDFSLHLYEHRLRCVSKRGSVMQTVNGVCPVVHSSAVQCVVDPQHEDKGCKLGKFTRDSIKTVFEGMRNNIPGGGRWDLVESIGAMTLQDWVTLSQKHQSTLTKRPASASALAKQTSKDAKPKEDGSTAYLSSTLFFTAPGRFGSALIPRDLSVVNLESIGFAFISDLVYNDISHRQQTATDIQKKEIEIKSEHPLHMAALLSLTGVCSIVNQQWSISFTAQQRFLSNFWDQFTRRHTSLLKAVGSCNYIEVKPLPQPMTRPSSGTNTPTISQMKANKKGESALSASSTTPSAKAEGKTSNRNVKSSDRGSRHNSTIAKAGEDISATGKIEEVVEPPKPIKKWITLSRVVFGMPSVYYHDNEN